MDIALSQIERGYHGISFEGLEELRRIFLFRLSCSDMIQTKSKFVALDETRGILNWIIKLLTLGSDKELWIYHGRN